MVSVKNAFLIVIEWSIPGCSPPIILNKREQGEKFWKNQKRVKWSHSERTQVFPKTWMIL